MTGLVGTRDWRVTRAIHLNYTTKKTQEEIGEELGVSRQKVSEYLNEPPAQEVEEFLDRKQAEVREAAVAELRETMRVAGEQARTAEAPSEVWTDEDGEIEVADILDADGQVVDRDPVPQDFEMGPDRQERFFRREEMRETIDLMSELLGIKPAEEYKHEHSGEIESKHTLGDDEKAAIRSGLAARRGQDE